MAARIDISMPVGNEGAGLVTEAGTSAAAQALMGKTVAVLGGAMYAQYRCVKVNQCLVLPRGRDARPRAHRVSSIRSPRWGWWARCGARGTRLWCTPPRLRTSDRCSIACASRTASALVNIVRKKEQEDLIAGGRRGARVPHGFADVFQGSDGCPGRDRRHDSLRCDRRRPAGGANPELAWKRR